MEPSAEEAGQTLLERQYTNIQITGNAWLVRHTRSGDELFLTWTPRGAEYPNNWSLPDDLLEHQFRLELYSGGDLVAQMDQSEASATIPVGMADTARIAPIGLHQRLGEWVSIPLPPP